MRLVLLLAMMAPAFAVTPEGSPAALEAIRAGEIIGSASACGVPEERLGALRRKAADGFRSKAASDADLDIAHLRYDQAIERGAEQIRSGKAACASALDGLAAFERS